jgi:hypothetical protein
MDSASPATDSRPPAAVLLVYVIDVSPSAVSAEAWLSAEDALDSSLALWAVPSADDEDCSVGVSADRCAVDGRDCSVPAPSLAVSAASTTVSTTWPSFRRQVGQRTTVRCWSSVGWRDLGTTGYSLSEASRAVPQK